MKYLHTGKLTELTNELSDAICGTRIINGRIEAYSCKRAGTDKKYAHSLTERFKEEVSSNQFPFENSSYAKGPLGDFQETSTQRLLTDLILTLNASFPDYDFSDVKPSNFRRISSPKIALNRINERLSDLATRKHEGFLSSIWASIDEVITLSDCKVFSFQPTGEGTDDGADPFMSSSPTLAERSRSVSLGSYYDDEESETELGATLWSFNYFFVNKQLKRILFFTCVQSCLKEDAGPSDDEISAAGGRGYALYDAKSIHGDDEIKLEIEIGDAVQPTLSMPI